MRVESQGSPGVTVWQGLAWLAFCTAIAAAPARGSPQIPDGFVERIVASGFDAPVGMAWLPDGRFLVIEQQTARLRLVVDGTVGSPDPIFVVPEVNTDGYERGLLGVAVDPAFPARPYVYLYFSHAGTKTSFLVMYTLTGDLADPTSRQLLVDPASAFAILTDIPDTQPQHNGGGLRFGPDGFLYVSLGDDAQGCPAQSPSSLLGAVLRLDVGQLPLPGAGPPPKASLAPPGNPFAGPDDNARLTVAYGLRNPFRISVDDPTGRVLIGDVGLSRYEEVDLLEPVALGANFGWPWLEGPAPLTTCAATPPCCLTEPIVAYDRSSFPAGASVIGALVYRPLAYPLDASFPPAYDGDYFFADYYAGFLRRLREGPDGTWAPVAPVKGQPNADDWATGLVAPADFSRGPDGALYYVSQASSVHRIAHVACLPTPRAGCSAPAAGDATLTLHDGDGSGNDRLRWTWRGSPGAPRPDFGRPLGSSDFVLCVYSGDELQLQALAPGGGSCGQRPCWKATLARYTYDDPELSPAGVRKMRLGFDGGIAVRGLGPNLDLPALPLASPVRVQLQRSDSATCWEASISSPRVNEAQRFHGTSD